MTKGGSTEILDDIGLPPRGGTFFKWDHSTIVKFSSRSNSNYRTVWETIALMVRDTRNAQETIFDEARGQEFGDMDLPDLEVATISPRSFL